MDFYVASDEGTWCVHRSSAAAETSDHWPSGAEFPVVFRLPLVEEVAVMVQVHSCDFGEPVVPSLF